jgi:hypothetical protein
MVRWFTRSELRLVASRKDEQDRAVDHKSLEDAVVMSHGTDHSLGLCMSLSNENLRCLQSCDPADTE